MQNSNTAKKTSHNIISLTQFSFVHNQQKARMSITIKFTSIHKANLVLKDLQSQFFRLFPNRFREMAILIQPAQLIQSNFELQSGPDFEIGLQR